MKKFILTICTTALLLLSCNSKKETKQQTIPQEQTTIKVDDHSSQNSLDWIGTYKGTIPCADCEGIEEEVILNKDLTYTKNSTYLGKGDNKFTDEGFFTWDNTGSVITLTSKGEILIKYQVGENHLTMLNIDGKVNDGELAKMYILRKM